MAAPLAALLTPGFNTMMGTGAGAMSPGTLALLAAMSGDAVAGAGAAGLLGKPEEGQAFGDRLRRGEIFPNAEALFGRREVEAPSPTRPAYGQSMATPEELAMMAKGQSKLPPSPSVGTASRIFSRAQRPGGDSDLDPMMQKLRDLALQKQALARRSAEGEYVPTVSDLVSEFQRGQAAPRDKMQQIAAAMAGGFVDASSGNPFGAAGQRFVAERSSDRKLERENLLAKLGFTAKDLESANVAGAAKAKRGQAIIGTEGIPLDQEGALQNVLLQRAEARRKEQADLTKALSVAKASHPGRPGPLEAFDAITGRIGAIQDAIQKQGGKATPQQNIQLQGLQGMLKQPKAEKFDKAEYDAASAAAQSIVGQMQDKKKAQEALAAWQMDAMNLGPQQATLKLYGYVNSPVGK